MEIEDTQDNIEEHTISESANTGNKTHTRRKWIWQEQFNKIKETCLDENLTWEEKIKQCGKIIFDKVLSTLTDFLSQWSCFIPLKKWKIGLLT